MVPAVTRPRKPSEVLSLAFAVVACLAFVLGLRDLSGGRLATPAFKLAEPIRISGLERSASLVVAVVTESGAGIGAATVQVFWEHDARFYWAGAEATDPPGRATLRQLPEGRVWLLAEAPGFARGSSALLLSATPRTVRLTLHPAQKLNVTVQDETSVPIAQATVLVDTADPLPFG